VKTTKNKEHLADLALLSVAIIWGVTFLMVQEATRETPVFAFLFWRFFLSTLFFGVILLVLKKKIHFPSLKYGAVLGILFCLAYLFQTFGLVHTLSSVVGFITGLSVILVPFLAWILLGHHQSIFGLLGALLSAVGLWLISTGGGSFGLGLGEFLTLVCATLFALHIVYTGLFSHSRDVNTLVLTQFATASLICLLLSLLFDSYTIPPKLSPTLLVALGITSVFATVFAFFVQTYAQQFTTPAKTAIIFTAEPVSAGVFGYFYGGEPLGVTQILGGGLIVGAILIVELGALWIASRRLGEDHASI